MTLLVVLTVVEVVLVVSVLAVYLVALHRRLLSINANLAHISFGVRAVEEQTSSIGPSVTELNIRLGAAAGILSRLSGRLGRSAT